MQPYFCFIYINKVKDTILKFAYTVVAVALTIATLVACQENKGHTAPAINDRDSASVMTTYGVNTLISDSGVIKYRLVAEEWEVNEVKKPSRWIFNKGVLLTQFDLKKHIVGYIQCDSATYFDKERRWALRGRVRIVTAQGLEFHSSELYWDEQNHLIWSHKYSHLKTPEKELEGNWFRSNEDMSEYEIRQAKGWNIFKDHEFGGAPAAPMELQPIDTLPHNDLKGTITNR